MLEFRIKYLTFDYVLAFALNLLIFNQIPETIGLVIHVEGIGKLYAVAHKAIEFIPLAAYSCSLILCGRKRMCGVVVTLTLLILSIYISRIFN